MQEQAVPQHLELDEHDATALHLLILAGDGLPAGTARMMVDTPVPGSLRDPEILGLPGRRSLPGQAKIGRVAVRASFRGQGLASRLMRELEAEATRRGHSQVVLDAQVAVMPFYEGLGYRAHGPVFDDAGIDHRKMSKDL